MHYLALLVAAYVALNTMDPTWSSASNYEWQTYKQTHAKEYASSEEEALRRILFSHNKQQVDKFNADVSKSYELAVNKFSDRTGSEMARLRGFKRSQNMEQEKMSPKQQKYLDDILNDPTPVPDSVDWRKVPNRVSSVKDQGMCGSCWAFSTVGSLEGQEIVRGKKSLVSLSVQNLVDCAPLNGCEGGNMVHAMQFISQEGGIDDDNSYPYIADEQTCAFNKTNVVFSDDGSVRLTKGDEEKLKSMVAKFGPVSIAIDSSTISFYQYKSGVLKDSKCSSSELDHGVLVVGYGTDAKEGPYWIVKNSWGKDWGDHGYVLMARNFSNMCGIATYAVIPYYKK